MYMVAHHRVLTLLHWHYMWQHELDIRATFAAIFSSKKKKIQHLSGSIHDSLTYTALLEMPCGYKTEAHLVNFATPAATECQYQPQRNLSHTHTQKNAKCLSQAAQGRTITPHCHREHQDF